MLRYGIGTYMHVVGVVEARLPHAPQVGVFLLEVTPLPEPRKRQIGRTLITHHAATVAARDGAP